jgi:hypothetical protein
MARKRSERDPGAQATLDQLKEQVKADLRQKRAPGGNGTARAGEDAGPMVARFLALAEHHAKTGTAARRSRSGQ